MKEVREYSNQVSENPPMLKEPAMAYGCSADEICVSESFQKITYKGTLRLLGKQFRL